MVQATASTRLVTIAGPPEGVDLREHFRDRVRIRGELRPYITYHDAKVINQQYQKITFPEGDEWSEYRHLRDDEFKGELRFTGEPTRVYCTCSACRIPSTET